MIFGPYPAVVTGIHDGDTISLDLDLGFGTHQTQLRARLFGINAPELSTASGKDALRFLQSILPIGAVVTVRSHGWDKYGGRFDATVVHDGIDLSQAMLSSAHAVPM